MTLLRRVVIARSRIIAPPHRSIRHSNRHDIIVIIVIVIDRQIIIIISSGRLITTTCNDVDDVCVLCNAYEDCDRVICLVLKIIMRVDHSRNKFFLGNVRIYAPYSVFSLNFKYFIFHRLLFLFFFFFL